MKKIIQYCAAIAFWVIAVNAFAQSKDGLLLTPLSVHITGGPTFCGQGTIYAVPSGGVPPYTYSWGAGFTDDSLVVTTQGMYSVIVTDATGSTTWTTRFVFFITDLTATISCGTQYCGYNELLASCAGESHDGYRYYIRDTNPWGNTWNDLGMDAVFGPGNWFVETYATDPAAIFSDSTQFVYMEGSDSNAIAMNNFVTANITLIEDWVQGGGRLFMNAAPTQGGDMNWGFGGVTLNYNHPQDTVEAVTPLHLLHQGPFLPTAQNLSGNHFSNGHITGCTIPVFAGNDYDVLSYLIWGKGEAFFGAMTTANWQNPMNQAQYIRNNLINYLVTRSGVRANYTYLWSNGSTTETISATASGTYSVTISNGYGCSATATTTIVVNQPIPIILQNGAVIITDTFTTYQWYLNGNILNGATSQTYTPTQDGDYTVVVSDANGCTTTSTAFPVNFTGTDDLQQGSIRIYPNPATHVAIVEGLLPNSQLTLFDGLGQKVWVGEASSNSHHIPLDGLASGIYYVRVSQGGEVTVLLLEKE